MIYVKCKCGHDVLERKLIEKAICKIEIDIDDSYTDTDVDVISSIYTYKCKKCKEEVDIH